MLSGITRKNNVRSTLYWFTESCNSQCLSHFAAPFIVVRAETSITGSCVVYTTESHQRKWTEAQRNPRMTRCFTSRLTLSAGFFQEKRLLKRQDNASRSSHLHCRIPLRYRTLSTSWLENINPIPLQDTRQSLRVQNTPVFQDRLTHVQLLFT